LYAIGEASNQAGSTLTFDVTGLLQDAVNRRDIAREARIALVDVGDVPQSGGGRSYQPAFASTLDVRRGWPSPSERDRRSAPSS